MEETSRVLSDYERAAILERAIYKEIGRANVEGAESWQHWTQSSFGILPARIIERDTTSALLAKKRWAHWLGMFVYTVCSLGLLFWVWPLYIYLRGEKRSKLVSLQVDEYGSVIRELV